MFETLFAKPILNLFTFFLDLDWVNAGIAIILTTLVIKIILFPLQKKQIKTQIATKKAEPEIKKIKEKYKKITDPVKKQQMGMEMMNVYKKYNMNPFAPLLVMIIQIPILMALYWTFQVKTGSFQIDKSRLYDFISMPSIVDMNFFGIDLLKTSFLIAILTGITQFISLHITMPEVKFSDFFKKQPKNFKDGLLDSMKVNMKFGLPIFIIIILSTYLSSALGLYWITSNLFLIFQELLVRKDRRELKELKN